MRNTFYKILFISFFVSALIVAQTNSDSTENNEFVQKSFSISGEIGAYGELYSMQGQPERRPKSTGRIFFRPTLNLFNLIQLPFEFLISSEGSSARQNINEFGISPSWGWGTLHLGDFTEDYSQYTLNGIKIRGGGLNITPGNFRMSTSAGYTQRSVPGGAQDGSFKRFLFAAKLGYGNEEISYVDFIFLRAKDEVGSLDQSKNSITIISPNGNDVLEIGSLQSIRWNSFGISGGLKIEVSRDGGNTFELIADNQPNVSFYNWTVTGPATFQAIVKISSIDDPNIFDVSDFVFSIGTGVESNIVSNLNDVINSNAVTPQENLVIGTKGKISFLENKVSIEFDGGGSLYTRDLRAKELDLDSADVPKFLSNIYRVKVGTNYDYAFNTFLNLNFQSFSSKIGYKRIGPGYNSLGTSYMLNDIEEYTIMNTIRISSVELSLGYIHQNDNLINQKLFTTARNIINIGATSMITQNWNASISANILNMNNNSESDSLKTDFVSFVLSTNHSFLINQTGFFRTINFNYAFQNSNNKSYLLKNNKTYVHTFNMGAGFNPFENITSVLSAGFLRSVVFDTIKTFTQNYSLLVQHNALSNRFINSLNLTSAFSENNTSFRTTLTSGYRFTDMDNISVSVSYMKFNGSTLKGNNFNEVLASLNYSHQF